MSYRVAERAGGSIAVERNTVYYSGRSLHLNPGMKQRRSRTQSAGSPALELLRYIRAHGHEQSESKS